MSGLPSGYDKRIEASVEKIGKLAEELVDLSGEFNCNVVTFNYGNAEVIVLDSRNPLSKLLAGGMRELIQRHCSANQGRPDFVWQAPFGMPPGSNDSRQAGDPPNP